MFWIWLIGAVVCLIVCSIALGLRRIRPDDNDLIVVAGGAFFWPLALPVGLLIWLCVFVYRFFYALGDKKND